MQPPERSVLHVLPHPGGGGATYVDVLSRMPGYSFSVVFLASTPTPSPAELARGLVESARRVRGHHLVHTHGEIASGLCLPLLVTRPSIVTLHGLHLARRLSGLRQAVATFNLRALLRAADCTICVSQAEHDVLRFIAGPQAARRAVVVHNGVRLPPARREADRAAVREELGIAEAEPVGIWIGSLDERKDPLAAVRAAAGASVALLVVGDGPLRSEVERITSGRIRVLGQRADVPRLFAAADFYVLTSRREGLALSLLEAMSHGLPAVVTDLAENVEALGDSGIAIRLGDEGALVQALRRIAESESERAALSRRARQRIAELFDVETMITQTRAIYDAALEGRKKDVS